ncbi:hypothetical protein DHD05_13165 [Arenibacter sp. N53]|nr:hypothetical protein [Arenibacter sp. N53]
MGVYFFLNWYKRYRWPISEYHKVFDVYKSIIKSIKKGPLYKCLVGPLIFKGTLEIKNSENYSVYKI